MSTLKQIILEEILNTTANYPEFGERLLNLQEVGEANLEPYSYTYNNISFDEVHYDFDTEVNDYAVIFILEDRIGGAWNLQFGVVGGTPQTMTNEFKTSKIMSTIAKIIYDFIDKHKPNIIKFIGAKSKSENDMRRHHIYMTYIKKNMRPDYFVYEQLPYIIIERKNKIINKNVVKI